MSPRYTIRVANGSDDTVARVLADLHTRIFADSAPLVDFKLGWWWIVWLKNTPVGFAGMTKSDSNSVYLSRSGVLREHRGHGLQRRLIKTRHVQAKGIDGAKYIITDTTDNPASSNNLMSLGFRLYDPEWRWAFEHSLYWWKAV